MEKNSRDYEFGASRVTVILTRLEQCDADVLVSSDDDQLSMGGGVSQALLREGGQAIRNDAIKRTPVTLGDVVVTSAGDLPAKHIFHAITRTRGTTVSEDREANKKLIESATRKCLEKLQSMELASIAFPALGTGYAGFQVLDAAETMAGVIVRHLKTSPDLQWHVSICIHPDAYIENLDYRDFFNRFDDRTGLVAHVVHDHAVVMIHGIRTEALWFDVVGRLLAQEDHAISPLSAGYSYFDLFRFLLPGDRFRSEVVARVRAKLNAVQREEKFERVSVIAHSFGTFVIGEILKADPALRLHRLVLCGSVLPPTFDWGTHAARIDPLSDPDMTMQRVVNDCGWRDIWPLFAESVTWGYGSAGRFGFQTPQVKDRYHSIGHSDFFKEGFVKEYWVPLFTSGTVVQGPRDQPPGAWWVNLLRVVKLRWLLVAGVLCVVAWGVF